MDGISGSLSSLAGGFHLGENHLTTELVTMPFELKTTGSTTLKGDFYTFGQHASNPQPHKLVVYARSCPTVIKDTTRLMSPIRWTMLPILIMSISYWTDFLCPSLFRVKVDSNPRLTNGKKPYL